jgi:AcrR family transcriptional regulator
MTELVAREGYATTSIAQVISLARVSRSTFYEHFEDKLDCFLALERDLAARALSTIERTVQEHATGDVTHTVLSTLVELSERDPAGARVMLTESLAAGQHAMEQRDRLLIEIGQLVEDAWDAASSEAPVLDIPAHVLVGGVCRLLSLRILRGASGPTCLRGPTPIRGRQASPGGKRSTAGKELPYPVRLTPTCPRLPRRRPCPRADTTCRRHMYRPTSEGASCTRP